MLENGSETRTKITILVCTLSYIAWYILVGGRRVAVSRLTPNQTRVSPCTFVCQVAVSTRSVNVGTSASWIEIPGGLKVQVGIRSVL